MFLFGFQGQSIKLNLSKIYSLIYISIFIFVYMKTIFLHGLLKNITNISEYKLQQNSCIFNINILVELILTSWSQRAVKIVCFVVHALTLVEFKYELETIIEQ